MTGMKAFQAGFFWALLAALANGQSGAAPAAPRTITINITFDAAPVVAPGTNGNQIVQTPAQVTATMVLGPPNLASISPRPDIFLIAAGQSSVTLTAPIAPGCTPAVYRNGVLMAPGYDYTISGQTFTFLPGQALIADDKVQVWYVPVHQR